MNNLHSNLSQPKRCMWVVCVCVTLCLSAIAQNIEWHPQKCKNGKYGYWNRETTSYAQNYDKSYAKWLFKPIFEEASEFNADSIAVVKKDGKYRFMNMKGDYILPTQYNYAENFLQGIGIITDDAGATYAINYQGERISPVFEELHRYGRVIYGKNKGSKGFSLLDAAFKEISSRKYHEIEVRTLPYSLPDGNSCYYLICRDSYGRVSYCDALGNEIVKTKYCDIKPPYQKKPIPDDYIGLYVKWKKLYKDGVHNWDWSWFKILWDPDTNKWGVIELKDGIAIVSFKHEDEYKMIKKTTPKMYKLFKSKIKNKAYRDSVFAIYGPATQQLSKAYMDIATTKYPQNPNVLKPVMLDFACLTPDSVVDKDKRMILLRDSVQFGKPYRDIVRNKDLIVVTDTLGKKGFMNCKATILPQCPYDDILLWDDSTYFAKSSTVYHVVVSKNHKYGLMNTKGDLVIPIEYDMIFPKSETRSYGSSCSLAMKDDLYYIINDEGKVSKRGYEEAQRISYGYKVTKYGLTTTYRDKDKHYVGDMKWEVTEGETPTLYEMATRKIDNNGDYKVNVGWWEIAAELADNNADKGNAYNNAGVLCIKNGNRDGAYYYYEKGAAMGNKYSISNLNAMRNRDAGGQTTNGWVQLAEVLSDLANNINGAVKQYKSQKQVNRKPSTSSTRITPGKKSTYSGNSSSTSNNKIFYQSKYSRWENTARSAYQSATNLGIRVKDKNNKDEGGTYGGKLMYWNTYKNNLTKAQREMRNIRLEAQRNGCLITQSSYETVTLILR